MRTAAQAGNSRTPTATPAPASLLERTRQAIWIALLAGVFLCASPAGLGAQSSRFAFGGDYDYVHTNAPPGGCGCFSMNGGDGWVGVHLAHHLSAVFQAAGESASNINGTSSNLTLISYLAGPRFTLLESRRIRPFAQALFGGAYASGLLTPAPSGASGSANVFALSAGGGVDVGISSHIAIRAVDVDYFYTQFNNDVNQHQNNLRVSAGIVFRFGAAR
jgi:outer membrane immunogenic protein